MRRRRRRRRFNVGRVLLLKTPPARHARRLPESDSNEMGFIMLSRPVGAMTIKPCDAREDIVRECQGTHLMRYQCIVSKSETAGQGGQAGRQAGQEDTVQVGQGTSAPVDTLWHVAKS